MQIMIVAAGRKAAGAKISGGGPRCIDVRVIGWYIIFVGCGQGFSGGCRNLSVFGG